MFEDIRQSLGLNTSPEGGVFDFEFGPVAEDHILEVLKSKFTLESVEGVYNDELKAREKLAVRWAGNSDFLGSANGIELDKDMSNKSDMSVAVDEGNQSGIVQTNADAQEVLDRVELPRQDVAGEDSVKEEITAVPESLHDSVTKGVEADDFTKDQERIARKIKARNLIEVAYSDHQNAA